MTLYFRPCSPRSRNRIPPICTNSLLWNKSFYLLPPPLPYQPIPHSLEDPGNNDPEDSRDEPGAFQDSYSDLNVDHLLDNFQLVGLTHTTIKPTAYKQGEMGKIKLWGISIFNTIWKFSFRLFNCPFCVYLTPPPPTTITLSCSHFEEGTLPAVSSSSHPHETTFPKTTSINPKDITHNRPMIMCSPMWFYIYSYTLYMFTLYRYRVCGSGVKDSAGCTEQVRR